MKEDPIDDAFCFHDWHQLQAKSLPIITSKTWDTFFKGQNLHICNYSPNQQTFEMELPLHRQACQVGFKMATGLTGRIGKQVVTPCSGVYITIDGINFI